MPSDVTMAARWVRAAVLCITALATTRGAVIVSPGRSIPLGLKQAGHEGDSELGLLAGVYPTLGASVYFQITRSMHLRGIGGAAIIDCGGEGSGAMVLLSSGMHVTFSDVHFRNCTSRPSIATGRPTNLWGPGHGPRSIGWCKECWCAVELCSKGGAVTITNALANASAALGHMDDNTSAAMGNEPMEVEVHDASVAFVRCDFRDNSADKGGAVAFALFTNFTDTSFSFEDTHFSRNKATESGAAIDVLADYAFTFPYYPDNGLPVHTSILRRVVFDMQGCRFEDNHGMKDGTVAFWSAAAHLANSNFSIRSSEFIGNQGGNGGALAIHVGALLGGDMNTFLFENVLFDRNAARGYAVGGAIIATLPMARTDPEFPTPNSFRKFSHRVQLITRNSVFRGNSAYTGGAYSIGNGRHIFQNVSFLCNTAKKTGGGICLGCMGGGDAEFVCDNSSFSGNSADEAGSTFSSESSGAVDIRNCSFDMTGSGRGITDFEFKDSGEFRADEDTTWRCKKDERMLHTNVSIGTSGEINPDWTGKSIVVQLSRMSIACLACAVNQFSIGQSMLSGPTFAYGLPYGEHTSAPGERNYVQHEQCYSCNNPVYEFVEDGKCRACPAGKALQGGGQMSEENCQHDWAYMILRMVVGLITALCGFFVPMLVGMPTCVQDVSLEHGQLVVETCVPHRLLRYPCLKHRVWLRDTGHVDLDGRTEAFGAHILDRNRFVLLDDFDRPISWRADASRGSLVISRHRALLCCGFEFLPAVLAVPILLGIAAAISFTKGLAFEHVARDTAIGLVVGTLAVCLRRRSFVSTISRRRKEMRKLILAGRPKPQPCPRGPARAISIGKLADFDDFFQAHIRDRNMYYVNSNLIMPLTEPEKLSYAELVGASSVDFFVSHYWGHQFRLFTESLRRHAKHWRADDQWKDTTYWICSFSNNQWNLKEELPGDCDESSFYIALRDAGCKGTAMVLDERAEPLQRSWCLFELLQTFRLIKERGEDFNGLSLCTASGVLNGGGTGVDIAMGIAQRLETLDLQFARATRMDDKVMIDNRVRMMEGGFPAMNQLLRSNVRDALTKVKDSFMKDFMRITVVLDGTKDGLPDAFKRGGTHDLPLRRSTTLNDSSLGTSTFSTLLIQRTLQRTTRSCSALSPDDLLDEGPITVGKTSENIPSDETELSLD
mmetsp:Transcript_33003/g.108345  ORF Transcript_33003/g.108345 Transcript_33003/m.108345 type:complete len:1174 (+) Transcript_33003:48-3569(+)